MMLMSRLTAACLCVAALAARPAAAQLPALSFTPGATGLEDSAADFGQTSFVLGWSFTANVPLTVTQLGWDYDPAFVSLAGVAAPNAPHDVGLFDAAGALLTATTVAYGGAPGFSYGAAAPVVLAPGQTYTVAGVTGADDPFFFAVQDPTRAGNVGVVVDPALTYGQDRVAVGASLTVPTGSDAATGADPAYFGPDFRFTPAAVPEPAPVALLAFGLVLLCGRAARRSRT